MCLDTGKPCCYHIYHTINSKCYLGYFTEEWAVCCYCGNIRVVHNYTDNIPTENHGKYMPATTIRESYFPDKDLVKETNELKG